MGSIVSSVHRARLVAVIVLSIAIPVGGVGAWAFNPDRGAVLHSEILWRIFGLMCEGGLFVLMVVVVALGMVAMVRTMAAIGRSLHA